MIQLCESLWSRSWCASTTDHEEQVELSCFCDEEQIVASRATDHGRNRGSALDVLGLDGVRDGMLLW